MPTHIDMARLRKAVDWSVEQLEEPRAQRLRMVRQYVGSHYAYGGADRRVPVNMLEMAVTIYVQKLAARAPRVMVTSGVDHLKPYAKAMEIALNQIPREIGLEGTLRKVVMEAIFGIGVCKVGLCNSGVSVLGHDPGEPFVDLVTPDDYFLDMSAKSMNACQFEGNDYWLNIEAARAMYDGDSSTVEPTDHTVRGERGESRAEEIGVREGADLYEDKVWLRDIWLPREQYLVTMGVKDGKVFRVIPWDGPEHGPFYKLSFNDVPGNLLPLAPASLWVDLHELSNELFRKLARQAEAKKVVVAFPGGNEESVEALKKARDGEGIRYTGQKPEMITVGGVDAETLALFLQSKDLFNYFGGNLDALGGLGAMSETATQDEMLTQGASARISRMKSDATSFAGDIFEALAWYEWTDPARERVVGKPVANSDIVLESVWSEETREGDWLDYNFDIDPYSMEESTPAIKLQQIGAVFERFVVPMLPMIQQQGGSIDFKKLIELIADLSNLDELRELIVFGEPIQGADEQSGDASSATLKPAHTTRTYERVNRPGSTRAGKDQALSKILMGSGVQGAEADSIGRSSY